ncbi:MAG: PKD domain-containing protein [Chloroflexi bacterium]|nr:PKD domain-containing protein [Chloroflexota bacterium]MCI0577015.1 PKD domain-containing protein [Chloroflexota bacterium]MCI0648829.1 PKD domain-containing protein [Chloroflexota bacterium]MCI0726331.1 PKD domain-containing protein [Chloroflexota bacterium]
MVFTDTSTPTGAADLWHWEFGDGGVASTQHPTHAYTTPGVFTVTLAITDTTAGETDTEVKVEYISTLSQTVIVYTYDPLYRLVEADYNGTLNANHQYQYDPVGNMTFFTETVGVETTRVERSFNDANELIDAFDLPDSRAGYYCRAISSAIRTVSK